eukprot:scaffold30904_cov88-Phaeocystis_antarctica.AAC.5
MESSAAGGHSVHSPVSAFTWYSGAMQTLHSGPICPTTQEAASPPGQALPWHLRMSSDEGEIRQWSFCSLSESKSGASHHALAELSSLNRICRAGSYSLRRPCRSQCPKLDKRSATRLSPGSALRVRTNSARVREKARLQQSAHSSQSRSLTANAIELALMPCPHIPEERACAAVRLSEAT